MSLEEFNKKFGTEKQCLDYLFDLRWPDGYCCPACHHDKKWNVKEFKYKCRNCGYQTTVTTGTNLHGTRIPIDRWFLAIWYFTSGKSKLTAHELQEMIKLGSNRTALAMLHTLRELSACSVKASSPICIDQEKLQGTVEIYRNQIRTPRGLAAIAFAVEIQKGKVGRIYMSLIEGSFLSSNLNSFVQDNVEPKSTLVGCQWIGWRELASKGYTFDQCFSETSLRAHKVETSLVSWLHSEKSCSEKPLADCLNEYCQMFNRDKGKGSKVTFYEMLQAVVLPKQSEQ